MSIHLLLPGSQLLDTSLLIVPGISLVLEGNRVSNHPLVDEAPSCSPVLGDGQWPLCPGQHRVATGADVSELEDGPILSSQCGWSTGMGRYSPPALGHTQHIASKQLRV